MSQAPPIEKDAVIAEELALHDRVKHAVRAAALAKSPDMSVIKQRLIELRDEAAHASERDLPSLFQQLYTHHSLAARDFAVKLPDMRAPYFAHIRLIENGKTREVLIGYQTFIDASAGVTIIDWRHAALAKVFFNFREGDEFELDLPGRTASGILAVRRVLTFEVGELVSIAGVGYTLSRPRGGVWEEVQGGQVPELAGGAGKAVNTNHLGTGLTNRKLPEVSALLDQEQYEILGRADSGALLILGGAGSGKTTVALHRMALLAYQRPRFYVQRDMRVIVPEQGLMRLTERLLRGLGLEDVAVGTFDAWVEEEGKHILKGLPKRLYDWTPAQTVMIKRHPAMLAVLDRYIEKMAETAAKRLRFLAGDWGPGLCELFEKSVGPIWGRLAELESNFNTVAARSGEEPSRIAWRRDIINNFLKEARAQVLNVDVARSQIYADPELHAILTSASGGTITPRMTAELAQHTRRQYAEAHGGFDESDMRDASMVDGQEVEADEYAGTIDVEDYAVLLQLMLRVHGTVVRKGKSLKHLRHLVIDEAQDLAKTEIEILGQAMAPESTITVAGDAAQQSDPTIAFNGWEDVMRSLGQAAVEQARLRTNYRCPRPVAELGHAVLGALAPEELPPSVRDGQPVVVSNFPSEGLAVAAMTEALTQLFEREPRASVAVVCATQENAVRLFEGLSNVGEVRLVTDGEFTFQPGIDVTDVSQVKGLEFDYVIIPDAGETAYPDTPVARRTMHIAVTRAVHQLWVMAVGRPSPLLPPVIKKDQ